MERAQVCGEARLHPAQPVQRELVERTEDWTGSSFRHYMTGEVSPVEIEIYETGTTEPQR